MNNIDILEEKAINAAVSAEWEEAIKLNIKILRLSKKNIEACLRLGYGYLQLYNFKEAKRYYKRVLRIQSSNPVAKENLERIIILEKKSQKKNKQSFSIDPNLFLESSGKTKSIELTKLGQKNTLASLMVGQKVYLKIRKRKVEIRTENDEYMGSLPDDLSKRLIFFINAKSKYSANIKKANLNKIEIFISEQEKGKRVYKYSSFPDNLQSNLENLAQQEASDSEEKTEELFSENDIDELAEKLTTEEKEDYLSFITQNQDDDDEEE